LFCTYNRAGLERFCSSDVYGPKAAHKLQQNKCLFTYYITLLIFISVAQASHMWSHSICMPHPSLLQSTDPSWKPPRRLHSSAGRLDATSQPNDGTHGSCIHMLPKSVILDETLSNMQRVSDLVYVTDDQAYAQRERDIFGRTEATNQPARKIYLNRKQSGTLLSTCLCCSCSNGHSPSTGHVSE